MTLLGQKRRARSAGVTVEEIAAREARDEHWCSRCRTFHPRVAFHADRTRPDGRARGCAAARSAAKRARYVPRPRQVGRRSVEARDGDKRQARHRVNYLIRIGLLPDPNDVACVDCGHAYEPGGTRHEYDHHRGYAAVHHEHVEAVCVPCHKDRCRARGEVRQRSRGPDGRYIAATT